MNSNPPTTQNYALRRKPCTNCIERAKLTPHETLETRFRQCCLSGAALWEQEVVGSNPAAPIHLMPCKLKGLRVHTAPPWSAQDST